MKKTLDAILKELRAGVREADELRRQCTDGEAMYYAVGYREALRFAIGKIKELEGESE